MSRDPQSVPGAPRQSEPSGYRTWKDGINEPPTCPVCGQARDDGHERTLARVCNDIAVGRGFALGIGAR